MYRSEFLLEVFNRHIPKDYSILEIGCNDNRNVDFLKKNGYTNVTGIDKKHGSAIEDVEPKKYDVIFTMSTLFLIKNDMVFEKVANMADKYIITIEGETSVGDELVGRDYSAIFIKHGFKQIEQENNVFNVYGVLRVMKKI